MDIEQLKKEQPRILTVTEAAEILGMTPVTLREGIKQGVFPFAVPIQMKQAESYIFSKRLVAYLEGYDLGGRQ